ncbi:MAG: proteophosphoglycan 5 [Candidatus Angelobacter sp.]|jgi:hypothetical protein|nr:proteophosphoglycan 5 [Candidatus Angelobacter sp.]
MKLFLTATMLLLSSSWALAQSGTPTTTNGDSQNSGSSSPSMQQPDESQNQKTSHGDQTVDGCLSGAAKTFVLTDASGKTYELRGETRELAANVGHQVRLWGNEDSTGGGARISASGNQATFGVKKVKSLSDTCK